MDIKTLTEQHPERVAQLFKAYGYYMPVTLYNTELFFKVNGNKEIPFSSYTDDQKQGGGKIWDILGKGLNVVGKAAAIINPDKYANANQQFLQQRNGGLNRFDNDRILGINKTLFITLSILVVIAFGIILFKRKQ